MYDFKAYIYFFFDFKIIRTFIIIIIILLIVDFPIFRKSSINKIMKIIMYRNSIAFFYIIQ